MLSRRAYGKLAAMYRGNAPPGDPGLPPLANHLGDGSDGDGSDSDGDGDGDGERAARGSVEEAEVNAAAAEAAESAGSDPGPTGVPRPTLRASSAVQVHPGLRVPSLRGPRDVRDAPRRDRRRDGMFRVPAECVFPSFLLGVSRRGRALRLVRRFLRRRRENQTRVLPGEPPFVGHVMSAMARAMRAALDVAERDDQPLTFVAFVPGWTDEPSWTALSESPHVRSKFVVAAADHGYCDGAAHQRKTSFRGSLYDTGVFVLQSSRAAASAAEGASPRGRPRRAGCRDSRRRFERRSRGRGSRRASESHRGDAAAGKRKKRKKRRDALGTREPEGGDEDGDAERVTKKKEKKKESKAAKRRRKRREEKATGAETAKDADGGEANE